MGKLAPRAGWGGGDVPFGQGVGVGSPGVVGGSPARRGGVPTMVVAGRFDKVRPPAMSEQFAGTIPGARYELIDAVHMMPAQAPGPLLALLQDFLGVASTRRSN